MLDSIIYPFQSQGSLEGVINFCEDNFKKSQKNTNEWYFLDSEDYSTITFGYIRKLTKDIDISINEGDTSIEIKMSIQGDFNPKKDIWEYYIHLYPNPFDDFEVSVSEYSEILPILEFICLKINNDSNSLKSILKNLPSQIEGKFLNSTVYF